MQAKSYKTDQKNYTNNPNNSIQSKLSKLIKSQKRPQKQLTR